MSDIPDGEALPPSERLAFEAWMEKPVAAHEDPAAWIYECAPEAAWQAWQARAVLAAPQNTPDHLAGSQECAAAFSAWMDAPPLKCWLGMDEVGILREAFSAGFAAAAPPLVPPSEPTPAMQQAGVRELRNTYWGGSDFARTCAIYRAMVAAAPPLVPPDFVMVPRNPTPEMIEAANAGDREYSLRSFGPGVFYPQGPHDHWVAMVAAAPLGVLPRDDKR